MESIITIVTTADSREVIERIGRTLLEARLIACIQVVGPVKSTYWWKGSIEEAEEWLALMKTRASLYGAVERSIREAHPYEVPEIVSLGVERGLESYVAWVVHEAHASEIT